MTNSAISRYEKGLTRHVSGWRRRKAMLAAFQQSLVPFLEENPSPSYQDLLEAFGPPEQMAQNLSQAGQLPPPFSPKKRIALLVCVCCALVCLGGGIFLSHNTAETGTVLSAPVVYPTELYDAQFFPIEGEPLTYSDSHWNQVRGHKAYLVEVTNTNAVRLTVCIRYSKLQPYHLFEVPPGETATFSVTDACPSQHIVSFTTPDGSLSGSVRVFSSQTPIV